MYDDFQIASYWIKPTDIVKSLNIIDVMKFLEGLGAQPRQEDDNTIVCATICHNCIGDNSSHKLYYYNDSKMFHCYTQCGENFSIFELYKRYHELNTGEILEFWDVISYAKSYLNISKVYFDNSYFEQKRESLGERYGKIDTLIKLPPYPSYVPDIFLQYYHPQWLNEGITKEVMDRFNIRFYLGGNKIIIPHHDLYGDLVGIRTRAFDKEDVEYAKYMPLIFGNITYRHQLGFNLFGLYEHQEAIKKFKRAVIYESEKSVLLDEVYNGKYSVAVATCGSSLNKYQIRILTYILEVNEICIAFDKEYEEVGSEEYKKYVKKLRELAKKYGNYAQMSYILDNKDFLKYKDSPIDRGWDIFQKLYDKKIRV